MANKKGFIFEFKQFTPRGSVMAPAVGTIIGGAFWDITSSLVGGTIIPLVGLLIGANSFSGLVVPTGSSVFIFSLFIQIVIFFSVLAFVVFPLMKGIDALQRKDLLTPVPLKEEFLLTQIYELLAKR